MAVISRRFDTLGQDGAPHKLGLYGGTFDPIHTGHLMVAEQAREQLGLDGVIFIPAGISPFKQNIKLASAEDRLAMCRLAVADNTHFDASSIEVDAPEISYTAETLKKIRQHFPENVELYFIAGADAISTIDTWKDPQTLASLAHYIGLNRPGDNCVIDDASRDRLARAGFTVTFIQAPSLEISSSDIRERLVKGKTVRYLVSEPVCRYVAQHHLYQVEGETGNHAGQ